ncbi:hypothetical protein BCON_0108g00050 [Botryotinia convoluta]|uniref:Uncharacterized protein n=1 Tax=Botryotinia convoluta TaxID=54673 RepID=A0A4Z1I6B5_9HELO|nr:hypothetical protein BCON_0108g00050 [Botryotinia convoluta]
MQFQGCGFKGTLLSGTLSVKFTKSPLYQRIIVGVMYFRVIDPITPVPKGFLGPYITYGIPLEQDRGQSFGPAKTSPHIYLYCG